MLRQAGLPQAWLLPAWLLAVLALVAPYRAAGQPVRLPLHRTRALRSDLEIGGDLAGVPQGETRFLREADLLRLPQQSFAIHADSNFTGPTRVSGIALERLAALLGATDYPAMVTALCADGYKANYPPAYLRAHHPVLVLRINGQLPAHWPRSPEGASMAPFMVSHPRFQPAFRVLAHVDEAQIPWGVVRLDLRREARVYAPIRPFGPTAQQPPVQQGFLIARQNCLRCHDRAGEGGSKADRSWDVVARRSVADPQFFDDYVRNPKSRNPSSEMAASPGYDAATLEALRAYFQPFSTVPHE